MLIPVYIVVVLAIREIVLLLRVFIFIELFIVGVLKVRVTG